MVRLFYILAYGLLIFKTFVVLQIVDIKKSNLTSNRFDLKNNRLHVWNINIKVIRI